MDLTDPAAGSLFPASSRTGRGDGSRFGVPPQGSVEGAPGPFVRVLHGMVFWSGEMIRPPEAAAGMALMAVILLIVNGYGPEPAG